MYSRRKGQKWKGQKPNSWTNTSSCLWGTLRPRTCRWRLYLWQLQLNQRYNQHEVHSGPQHTFRAPHSSTVSSSGTTTTRKYGVWKISFNALPMSLFLQPANQWSTLHSAGHIDSKTHIHTVLFLVVFCFYFCLVSIRLNLCRFFTAFHTVSYQIWTHFTES